MSRITHGNKYLPAPACQGHQGCGDGVHCPSRNWQSLHFKPPGYSFMSLEGPTTPTICPTRSTSQNPAFHQKPFGFETCLQGQNKKQKNSSQGINKTLKFEPEILRKRFPRQIDSCNTFYAKTSILKSVEISM